MSEIVCVTGASGFIGAHLVALLLRAGYHVRATLSSTDSETRHLRAIAEAAGAGQLTLHVANLTHRGGFDSVFDGADHVIHAAASVRLDTPPEELVEVNLGGTHNVLSSLGKAASVRTLIYTSSLAAVVHDRIGPGHVFDERDWSRDTPETDPYAYAKVRSEQMIEEFSDRTRDSVRVVRLQPSLALGPAHSSRPVIAPRFVAAIAAGALPDLHLCLPFVDVRDIAKAHVAALQHPTAAGRYVLSAGELWLHEVAQAIELAEDRVRPQLDMDLDSDLLMYLLFLQDWQMRICTATENLHRPIAVNGDRARTELGLDYLPLRQSVLDTLAEHLVDAGAKG
ncbi:MAG: NAD-dependent epimerase/dehydratase family protein [Planctomycetota bacterium]